MNNSEKTNITKEYIQRYYESIMFLPIKLTGFRRFDVHNGQIHPLMNRTLIHNAFILILANFGVYYLTTAEDYLKLPEVIAIGHFATFANLILINLSFGNRRSGAQIIKNCIEIDLYLGVKETSFMREIAIRYFVVLCVLVIFFAFFVVSYMYSVFKVSLLVHVVGSLYFSWLFCIYDDYSFFMTLYTFLSLRIRYLNVALMKYSNMNLDYVPDLLFFNGLFWKRRFDKLVTFHKRAGKLEFAKAFRIIFHQFDCINQGYRFALMLGVWTIVVGTFVSVQSFIIYIKNSDTDVVRSNVVTGWAVGNWVYMLTVSLQTDVFRQQIEQTNLICAYVLLKPTSPPETFELIKTVRRTLELRDGRGSMYSFRFDPGLVFSIAASTFVYITVQLQMAFPKLEDIRTVNVKPTSIWTNVTVLP